nr:uncharacterized protein LOC127304381 [Lolium perenne]
MATLACMAHAAVGWRSDGLGPSSPSRGAGHAQAGGRGGAGTARLTGDGGGTVAGSRRVGVIAERGGVGLGGVLLLLPASSRRRRSRGAPRAGLRGGVLGQVWGEKEGQGEVLLGQGVSEEKGGREGCRRRRLGDLGGDRAGLRRAMRAAARSTATGALGASVEVGEGEW